MTQAIDKHLAKAIVDVAIFLEFATEDVLNPDVAVAMMEQLAGELQLMPDELKNSLARQFQELAAEYGDKASFVETLGEALGLV